MKKFELVRNLGRQLERSESWQPRETNFEKIGWQPRETNFEKIGWQPRETNFEKIGWQPRKTNFEKINYMGPLFHNLTGI